LPDSIYLYGTDYMSNDDVKKYFDRFGVQKITWLNDSSCTVQFENTDNAERAYQACALSSSEGLNINLSENADPRN
jgi:hypothetical protein